MARSNMRVSVPSPSFIPSGYGLFSVIDWRTAATEKWQLGVTFESYGVSASSWLDSCIVSGTGAGYDTTKAATWTREFRGATPFTVYSEIDCSPVGFYEEADTIVRLGLERSEEYQVEGVFSSGTAMGVADGVYPHLAANAAVYDVSNILLQQAATIVSGTGVSLSYGLGALEKSLAACYHGVGVLHVPVAAADAFAEANLIFKDSGPNGQRWRTANGNLVSFGAGYANTAPDGTAAGVGQAWIYATGNVFGYRGGVRVFDRKSSLDRSVNTLHMIAERNYVIGFDRCLHAILVNL